MNIPSFSALLDRVRQIRVIQELCELVDGLQKSTASGSEEISDPGSAITAEVGKYYRIDTPVETLTITLPAITDGNTSIVSYYLTGGTTPVVTFESEDTSVDVLYQKDFEVASGKTYEINCLWNGANWVVVEVEIETT